MARQSRWRQRARHVAETVLREHGASIPVDVEAIVAAHGIAVQLEDFEDNVSGMLVLREGTPIIGINARHHPNRQRFSLAHELAHFLLHREQVKLFVDATPVFLRSDGSPVTTRAQEQEANAFAAELLMPHEAVREHWQEVEIDVFDDAAVKQLADRFNVSPQALVIRLTELDLVFRPVGL